MRSTTQGYQGFRNQRPVIRLLLRLVLFLGVLFLLYQGVTRIVVQSVEQQSRAMIPTLEPGDRAFLIPLLYGPRFPLFSLNLPGFSAPRRGDIVLVRPAFLTEASPGVRLLDPIVRFSTVQRQTLDESAAGHSAQQIKRIIGLPGDTVRIERFTAFVRPSGESEFQNEFTLSPQPYQITADPRPEAWEGTDPFGESEAEIELGANDYFLLSDNRSAGVDSRHWGPVGKEAILGRLRLRYWPFDRFGSL